MIRILLFATFSLSAHDTFAACDVNPERLGARYVETRTVIEPEKEEITHLTVWRGDRQIAHEYTDKRVTELWEKGASERMRLVLYFEENQRGIEYQPGEEGLETSNEAWLNKSHLIPADMLTSMELKDTSGQACVRTEFYEKQEEGLSIRIEWLPEPKLVKSATWATENTRIELVLEETVTDPADVDAVFARLSDYQTTDFADIGDQESDPFLQKMINLGFTGHDHGH
jgi:hypothetical protein